MSRVLIVDFEEDSRSTLSEALTARGHAVQSATMREAGVAMWKARRPDLVVVDIATVENDTFEPWRSLKATEPTSSSKLVVLTRSGWKPTTEDVDAVFEKPFRVKDFCECVEALSHARPTWDDEVIACGVLKVDRRTGAAVVAGEEVDLTQLERKLLIALYDRRPTPMSRGAILHTVWKMHEDLETRTIDTHVRRLRIKLGEAARFIVTVRGTGFAFVESAGETARASADEAARPGRGVARDV